MIALAGSALAKPLRLVERLGRDNVVASPLLDLDRKKLGEAKTRLLMSEDFEAVSMQQLSWVTGQGADIQAAPGGGKAMKYVGGEARQFVWVLPARASHRYRVSRRLRSSNLKIDLKVMETSASLRVPGKLNHPDDVSRVMQGEFANVENLIRVHSFSTRGQTNRWREDSLQLLSTPETRSLLLVLDDAEGLIARSELELWLDDVVVEELQSTKAQELIIMQQEDPAPGADPRLGMAKHGQLLPIGDMGLVVAPFDRNFEYRFAIFAPAPTLLEFEIDVLPGSRLDFSYALPKAARQNDRVRFRIDVVAQSVKTTLFEATLSLDAQHPSQWHEGRLSLAAYENQRIELWFSTESESGRGYAVWGDPVVDQPRKATDPPNVILVGIDTLRADHLSSYGNQNETTPNIDRLARDGVRFEYAISTSNWTSPAFASLFTGVMPSRHQVIHRARAIGSDYTTLAEHFRDGGWRTQAVVFKAYLYNMGFEQGFDSWFNVPRGQNLAQKNLNRVMQWLDEHGDERFFLFLHLNDPHQPFNQPAPFANKFNSPERLSALGINLPIHITKQNTVRGCTGCRVGASFALQFLEVARNLYDAEIAYMDDRLGVLIDALKSRGLYDHTIIAVVADHGEMLWDRDQRFGHGGNLLTDELVRVPLIIKPHLQAGIKAGKVVSAQVRAFDVMPTLLQMVDLHAPDIQAQSLLPMMKGADTADRLAISENVKQYVLAVRDGTWKYTLNHRPDRPIEERLYNLESDPRERSDLADQHPGTVAMLRRAAAAHFIENKHGTWMLVTGPSDAKMKVTVTSSSNDLQRLETFFGPKPDPRNRASKWAIYSIERLAPFLLVRVDNGDPDSLSASLESGGYKIKAAVTTEFDTETLLERLKTTSEPTIRLFRHTRTAASADDRNVFDSDQLENLRALGYVE
jgi:arylsulfatase A-like enzyme